MKLTSRKLSLAMVVALAAVLSWIPGTLEAHTIRGHSTHGRSRSTFHFGGHVGFYSYYHYPYFPYAYGYGYYPPLYGYPAYGPGVTPELAWIDTDISPEKAEIHIDGEYAGLADDFDGMPRYLAVEPGSHTLTVRAEGRRSVTRKIRVPRGALLRLEFTLPRGNGAADAGDGPEAEIVVPEPPGVAAGKGRDEEPPAEEEPGFLRLTVTPSDASVYIDGELYGSASNLSRLHGDLRLERGDHTIEVVRPGYRSETRRIDVRSGEKVVLDMSLEKGTAPR